MEIQESLKKLAKIVGSFLKHHIKIILVVVIAIVLIAGATYVAIEWAAKVVARAAHAFTGIINVSNNGSVTSNISAEELWKQMIAEGFPVNEYLDSPQELDKLMKAEMITKIPDMRSDVTKPIDWDKIFNPSKKDTINVLFIGNNKTYTNNLPDKFQSLSKSLGKNVYAVKLETDYGGRTLEDFVEEPGPKESLTARLKEREWDYIVLQEQTDAAMNKTAIKNGVSKVVKYVRDNGSQNAKIVYDIWTITNNYSQTEYDLTTKCFDEVREEMGGKGAYIAKAYLKFHEQYPNVSLFSDDRHPTHAGTYLAACCTYKAIFGENTENASYTYDISKELAVNIQKVADSIQDEFGKNQYFAEELQGIIKFIRNKSDGTKSYMTYASPEEFNGWMQEYRSSGSEEAKQKALTHFTLTQKKTNSNTSSGDNRVSAGEGVMTDISERIIEAANRTPWEGAGWCAAWVFSVYENAGINPEYQACARDAAYAHRVSLDKDQIPIGASVYSEGSGVYGHIGIYIGSGKVMDNWNDGVKIWDDINTWIEVNNGWLGWGWEDGNQIRGTVDDPNIKVDNNNQKKKEEKKSKVSNYTGQLEPTSESEDTGGYAYTYTSSADLTYKDFKQGAAVWSGYEYDTGNGKNDIGGWGCGITSVATILSGLGFDKTPINTADEIHYTTNIEAIKAYGVDAEYQEGWISSSEVESLLSSGKVMAMHYKNGSFFGGNAPFHYVAIVDTDGNGNFMVLNPGARSSGWYSSSQIEDDNYERVVIDTGNSVRYSSSNSDDSDSLGYQAVVATWTETQKITEVSEKTDVEAAAEALGVSIENEGPIYSMSTTTIDYEALVNPYTLNFDLLWAFLVLGQSKGFVMEWADMAFNSEIEIGVYDSYRETIDVDNWSYTEATDVRVRGNVHYYPNLKQESIAHEHYYKDGDEAVKTEDGYINKTVINKNNSITHALTKAHTWIADYDVEYKYNGENISDSSGTIEKEDQKITDWELGTIEDDPCDRIQQAIDKIINEVNTENADEAAQAAAERYDARSRALSSNKQYVDNNLNEYTETRNQAIESARANAVKISADDIDKSEVTIQTQINRVNIIDHTWDRIVTSNYTAGTPKLVIKEERNSTTANTTQANTSTAAGGFVELFNKIKYRNNKNNILSAVEWLFEIMEANEKLVDKIDMIKYLLYKATDINFGVTEYDWISELMGANLKSASSDYNVKTDTSGGAAIKPTKEQLKLAFQSTPYSKELLGDLDKIYEVQEKYKVNGIFTAAVQIIESSAGTDLSGQYGGGSASRYSILIGNSFKGYDQNGRDEETEDFAKLISDPEGYYFGEGKYTISQIGPTYCDENWVKSIKACMADMFRAAGIKISSNDDVVDYALQFEGMLQAEIPGFLGTTLSDGSLTVQPADWCAYFASWCFDQCGLIPSKLTAGNGAANDLGWLAYRCGKYNSNGTYMPNPGDLIFFDWNFVEPNEIDRIDHVAIVIDTDGNSVNYVGGNQGGGGFSSSHVTRSSMSLSSPNIVGFWNMSN